MDVANNWTIVVGIATIISMLFIWTTKTYLNPIRRRDEDIIEKVKEDLSKKLKESKKLISEIGEEKFVDEIYDIIEFRKRLRNLKEIFGNRIVPFGLLTCILVIILVSVWEYNIYWLDLIIFYILIALISLLIRDFLSMKKNENLISRYLEGENPTELLNEK